MKVSKLLAAFLLVGIFTSFSLSAQDSWEDVVYLKNGSIYRGMIIEQVPGVSLKIETAGGNVFFVALGDVQKFTKEKKAVSDADMHHGEMHGEGYYYHGERYDGMHHGYHGDKYAMHDSTRNQFHYRKKGYFNTAQLLIENLMGGGRLVNGYKFGQCGYLGIGIGFDFIFNDLGRNNSNYSGVYLPLYLHYGGDILKKRITPFYSIEAGYAMRMNPNGNNNGPFQNQNFLTNNSGASSVKGGMMGGVGFGVKFYSRHKIFASLSAHADFQQAQNTYTDYYINNTYYTTYHTNAMLMIPGIRFGLGF